MKKLFSILILLSTSLAFFVKTVDAHVLKIDNHIGAILHVDPDDDPIAGQQSAFFFEFKDTQNKFTPAACDCTFFVIENGKDIYSQPLFQNNNNPSLENASVFYTFPQKDVYQVKVVGKPDTQNAFQPFTLTYDIRVDRIDDTSSLTQKTNFFRNHMIQFIGGGIVVIIFLLYKIVKYKGKKYITPPSAKTTAK